MVSPHSLLVALATVPASQGVRVAVLPLAAEGRIDPGVAIRVHADVIAGLVRGGAEVADAAAVRELAPTGCDDATCVGAVASATSADYVVRPRLSHRDRNFTIVLELLDGTSGLELARAHDDCDICGLEEVATAAADQAALLHGKLASLQAAASTTVRIVTVPAGAQVWIDGQPVGVTPMVREVVPGSHTLRVEQRGFAAEQRTIDATEGIEQALQVELVALAAQRQPPRTHLIGGGAIIGIGLALATGGGVLLALDGRQYERRCSGRDVDIAGTCRLSYDTMAGGSVTLSVGLAAAAAGTALLIVGKRHQRRVAVSGGLRGVVLHGRF